MPGENDSENGGAWISHCIKVQTTKDLSGFLGVVSACVQSTQSTRSGFFFLCSSAGACRPASAGPFPYDDCSVGSSALRLGGTLVSMISGRSWDTIGNMGNIGKPCADQRAGIDD